MKKTVIITLGAALSLAPIAAQAVNFNQTKTINCPLLSIDNKTASFTFYDDTCHVLDASKGQFKEIKDADGHMVKAYFPPAAAIKALTEAMMPKPTPASAPLPSSAIKPSAHVPMKGATPVPTHVPVAIPTPVKK